MSIFDRLAYKNVELRPVPMKFRSIIPRLFVNGKKTQNFINNTHKEKVVSGFYV